MMKLLNYYCDFQLKSFKSIYIVKNLSKGQIIHLDFYFSLK